MFTRRRCLPLDCLAGLFVSDSVTDHVFDGLSCREYKRRQLADALVPMSYRKGEKIITQGVSDGVRFHIIERGQVWPWLVEQCPCLSTLFQLPQHVPARPPRPPLHSEACALQ